MTLLFNESGKSRPIMVGSDRVPAGRVIFAILTRNPHVNVLIKGDVSVKAFFLPLLCALGENKIVRF